MRKIIMSKTGASRLEAFCITGICILLALIIIWAIDGYRDRMAAGNDSLRVNTAESVATNNMMSSGCVVGSCNGGDDCTHRNGDGDTLGYYDSVTHHIVDEKMEGYNEYQQTSGETAMEGQPGTMIIEVEGNDEEIQLKWIEGAGY